MTIIICRNVRCEDLANKLRIMTKQMLTKNLWFGLLSWLIPFVVSFLFYKPGGELVVPYATFKSTIMVVGTLSGCYLMIRYFKYVSDDFIRNGAIVGLSWLAVNLILDTVILIPIMKTTFANYFMTIGISYISIPVISIAMGYLLARKAK